MDAVFGAVGEVESEAVPLPVRLGDVVVLEEPDTVELGEEEAVRVDVALAVELEEAEVEKVDVALAVEVVEDVLDSVDVALTVALVEGEVEKVEVALVVDVLDVVAVAELEVVVEALPVGVEVPDEVPVGVDSLEKEAIAEAVAVRVEAADPAPVGVKMLVKEEVAVAEDRLEGLPEDFAVEVLVDEVVADKHREPMVVAEDVAVPVESGVAVPGADRVAVPRADRVAVPVPELAELSVAWRRRTCAPE